MNSESDDKIYTSKIKIENAEESVYVVVKNLSLKKTLLKEYFPMRGTLTYKVDGKMHLLDSDEDYIFLDPSVDTYQFTATGDPSEPLGAKRRKHFKEVLESLYGKKDGQSSSPKTDRKIGNKKQETKEESNCAKKDKILPRTVHLGWKHRKNTNADYEFMGPTIGAKIKVHLNGNENYSLENLKRIFMEEYVNDENRSYFENSEVAISTRQGTIDKFVHDGKEYPFWEFIRIIRARTSNNVLNMYLLTSRNMATPSVPTTDAIDNYPSCKSLVKKNLTVESVEAHSVVHIKNTEQQQTRNTVNDKYQAKSVEKDSYAPMEGIKSNTNKENCNSLNSDMKSNEQEKVNRSKTSDVVRCEKPTLQVSSNIDTLKSAIATNSRNESCFKSDKSMYSQVTKTENRLKTNTRNESVLKSDKSVHSQTTKTDNSSVLSEFERPPKKRTYHTLDMSIKIIQESDIKFSNVVLGRGAQGVVTKGKYCGSHVAIKSMQKGQDDKLTLREILILDKIRHENIISIMAACFTFTQIHIVMEYFKSDSLFSIIFDPEVKKKYVMTVTIKSKIALQVARALAFLHLQPVPILHRDIKPNNILVNYTFHIKVCDLGLGKCTSVNDSLQTTRANVMRGTYIFMAPEVLLLRNPATTKSDVWGYACTLIELFNEESVWDVQNYFSGWCCAKEHLERQDIPNMKCIPLFAKDKILKCFSYEPIHRPDMVELLQVFEEQFGEE